MKKETETSKVKKFQKTRKSACRDDACKSKGTRRDDASKSKGTRWVTLTKVKYPYISGLIKGMVHRI